jgi:hypothetical protein
MEEFFKRTPTLSGSTKVVKLEIVPKRAAGLV